MDITIYLPDELGQRAKADPNVNLSRMLRDALADHYQQEDAMAATIEGATEYKLTLEDDEGRTYTGRITATRIAQDGDIEVFLTGEENVVFYDGERLRYWVVQEPEDELRGVLNTEAYVDAMHALGQEVEVDLDV